MKVKLNKLAAALAVAVTAMTGAQTGGYAASADTYAGTGELSLTQIARYDSGKSAIGKNGVEIVSFDPASQKAFTVNGDKRSMDIIDFSQLRNTGSVTEFKADSAEGSSVKRVLIQELGEAAFDDVTSIAVHPTEPIIAVAVLAVKPNKGHVAFFTKDGSYIKKIEAGYHPDMLTFTKDGTKLLVANEGEPTDDTYAEDPPGSVTIVDMSGGLASVDQSKVTDVTFDSLEADDLDSNVRLYPSQGGVYHKRSEFPGGKSWSVDLEPEYIAVDPRGEFAYVTLQENNAVAKLDLANKRFVHVYGLGYKDHSIPGNEIDISEDSVIQITKAPVLGTYMPDGMTLYETGGKTYLVTANEGDSREYKSNPSKYTEEAKIYDLKAKLQLDARNYKGYTQAELDQFVAGLTKNGAGALKVSTAVYDAVYGETGSAVYDALYTFGARSFSIWDADQIQAGPVFDSGAAFEQITAQFKDGTYFNLDNEGTKADKRSSSKGPEPEDVKLGVINGKTYAFIGLERVGGIMVYDISNPKRAQFVTYVNDRMLDDLTPKNNLGPEGLNFVSAENSPTGKPLLMVAHETSGSLLVYEISAGSGQYKVTAQPDTAYSVSTSSSGIQQMTVQAGVSGWTAFSAAVETVKAHAGTETIVFKQLRNGQQVALTAIQQDVELNDGPVRVFAGFNVQAGDIIEVFVVDSLTVNPDVQPVLLQ